MQVKLVDAFFKRYSPAFDHLRPVLKTCKQGTSRFEWVDSVLVKAIADGEWAVFENANICNPSILDRLNPLLEEGNQSMVINEQGLDDSTQSLRTVTAHKNFRAIFVLSQKSLIEQGKDVSRALRNRCLELSITFDPADGTAKNSQSELVELASQQLDARNLDWSLSSLQERFDLLPCLKDSQGDRLHDLEVTLGKRNRRALQVPAAATESEQVVDPATAYPFIYVE